MQSSNVIQRASCTSVTAAAAGVCKGSASTFVVGAELQVLTDYLDMEAVSESEGGLAHAGYLVVHRGEVVRLLYIGSAQTGDAGWLYAEVLRTLRAEPAGRRGWLPTRPLEQPASPPPPAAAKRGPEREPQGKPKGEAGVDLGKAAAMVAEARMRGFGRSAQSLPEPPPPQGERAHAGSALPRRRGGHGLSHQEFPVPAQRRGPPPPPDPEPEPPKPAPGKFAPKERAKAMVLQRAVAAAAAAAAKESQAFAVGQTCPICAEAYAPAAGRRPLRRPCCGLELCAQCDHKSLRSGKCYFCREASEEFPSLGLACRVATAS